MNISIVIADEDKEYVARLSEALQQYKDFTISVFTEAPKLQAALASRQFDILLFDPDINSSRLNLSGVKLAICLYSDSCKNGGIYSDCVKVLKYQRVSKLYKDVLREYADKAGYSVDFANQMHTKLIGVYSPVGGAGKTTVSLALACKLKALGKSVLFTNTEQLESSSAVNPHKEDGMAILIEDMGKESVNFKVKLAAVSKYGMNDMEYLEGFTKLVDYNAVTEAEITAVFEHVRRDCGYQYIVIDMGSNLDKMNRAVFEMADQILLVEKPGELPIQKTELFAQQVFAQEQKGKMLRLYNFAESNSVYANGLEAPVIGRIHNYGNLKLGNMVQAINANGEYDIGQLMD